MKILAKSLIVCSLLLCAKAQAWDPAAPVRGWVDTFADRCPSGYSSCKLFASRYVVQGWACANPSLGGNFDPSKIRVVALYNGWVMLPPPINSIQIEDRPDVVAYGACPTSQVGFRLEFRDPSGFITPYRNFIVLYDGAVLESSIYMRGGPY